MLPWVLLFIPTWQETTLWLIPDFVLAGSILFYFNPLSQTWGRFWIVSQYLSSLPLPAQGLHLFPSLDLLLYPHPIKPFEDPIRSNWILSLIHAHFRGYMKYHHCVYPLPHEKCTRVLYSCGCHLYDIRKYSGSHHPQGIPSRCWRERFFFLDSILQWPLPSSGPALGLAVGPTCITAPSLGREHVLVCLTNRDRSGCRAAELWVAGCQSSGQN